jgi:hypothetical protein
MVSDEVKSGQLWATIMPIILDTREAEIRRIVIQSQPRQILLETLSWKYPTQTT